MAWFKGSATDYQDFLDTLKNLAKDDHISAATIYDGGLNYAVGDTITLAGGTKNHEPEIEVRGVSSGDYASGAAVNAGGTGYTVGDLLTPTTGTYIVTPIIEVLTVSGGVVTSVQINNPGICTSQPSNPVTMTGGTGSGCTIDFSWTAGTGIITAIHISDAGVYTVQASNPVSQNTSSGSGTGAKFTATYTDTAWETKVDYEAYEATGTAIQVAGTGYTLNDIVTVVGGTFTEASTVKITAVSGGVPTSVSVQTGGNYSTTPSNPAATSGGTGTGLTLTMTWTLSADELKYLMLHNTNSDQYVGFKCFKVTSPETAYLIQVAGFTGFNSLSTPWEDQPGATCVEDQSDDTYIPLSGGASPATVYYWISIQDERIVAAFKVSSVYPNMYVGAPDPFMTGGEYNYPQLIMGCIARKSPYTYGGIDFAGMNNPGADTGGSTAYAGPGWLRSPNGSLLQVLNWFQSGGVATPYEGALGITPCGHVTNTPPTDPNNWYSAVLHWNQLFNEDSVILPAQLALKRINDEFILIPCMIVSESTDKMYGTMRGVFCINPDGVLSSEDRIYIGSDIYRCFQNCNKSNRNFFFVLKEN